MHGLLREFDQNFSTYSGRIHNIAGFLSDLINVWKNIFISHEVALVASIGDFLFSWGLFSPFCGRVDDGLCSSSWNEEN